MTLEAQVNDVICYFRWYPLWGEEGSGEESGVPPFNSLASDAELLEAQPDSGNMFLDSSTMVLAARKSPQILDIKCTFRPRGPLCNERI